MTANPTVALVWRGDLNARRTATLQENRLKHVAEALEAHGMNVQPAVYGDDFADEVEAQLLGVDAVLVWVNPLQDGRDRSILDPLLRRVAAAGVFVSAHPDVILRMGTKEILFETRDLPWGSDVHLYRSSDELRTQLPARLADGQTRVLKQYRGNDGNGVWKVEADLADATLVRARHAYQRRLEETLPLEQFLERCEGYFAGAGRMIDQPFQQRIAEGMVRCYLVQSEVAGFGHQAVNALYPAAPSEAAQPTPRLYHPPTQPEFAHLKSLMEGGWVAAMCERLGVGVEALPMIWDADFMLGPKDASGDSYVLCEVNVSSVYPFPDAALPILARGVQRRLNAR